LEKRPEQVLLGSEGLRGRERVGRDQGEEMTSTMYAHMNK
jgi:hypothetical protein